MYFRAFFVRSYDVRLYLNSLDEFDEAEKRKQKREDEEEEEATAEKLEEELCEEERYTDMYEDIQRREIEEAEQKRGKGAEIGFVYEGDGSEMKKADEEVEGEEEDEPYEKPESLKLPVGIVTPDTMRQNALIERTAQFVIAQGPQMEVVIKAKQRQNVEHFGFLDFDHRLHPYYKYLCKLIREKKYTPQPPKIGKKKKVKSPTPSASESDSENEGGYLHPLLTGSSSARAEAASPAPGFIGPSPRPPPQKPEKKPPSPGPNLDALIQQFHRSANENSLYSSLMKGLTSIIPGATKTEEKNEPEQEQQQQEAPEQSRKSQQQQQSGPMYELDEQRIAEYNTWHFDFYGRLSPYLPGPPPAPLPPAPDSAVESGITVAAKYVALHGALAEQRLIEHNRDKVHFLLPRSPYYTFYQSRVRQYQWHLLQQSQQQQQPQIIKIPTAPTPPTLLTSGLIPPQNPDLVPIQMPLDQPPQGSGIGDVTAESDPKQVERREKARLFMEKILNERMAEKHRKTKTPAAPTMADGQEKKKELKSEDHHQSVSAAQASGTSASASAAVSPLELSKAISCLIDEQLKRTLGTPSPKSPPAEKRKKKRRRRKDSSSSSSSSSSEDERRRRRRRRKEEEEERRRKRHHRDSRDRSSSRRRHRRRSHRRSRSESSRSRSRSPRR